MSSTTDPSLHSFIAVGSESHFPIHNLPYGVFRRSSASEPSIGAAIGNMVLDLAVLEDRGLLKLSNEPVFARPSLNRFMSLGPDAWREARSTISRLLQSDVTTLRDDAQLRDQALVPMNEVEMLVPCEIGDYTDFYSSREHATNVGTLLRGPDNALPPNWLHLPIAYHGRASSIVISGNDIHRPCGQRLADGQDTPIFGPSQAVDFELEMGYVIGVGNALGVPIPVGQAHEHMFGMVIVNDWSARDIQKWEYQPLGPFLSKNFATSISPWVVTTEALAPFRAIGPKQEPTPLPYLQAAENSTYDMTLDVSLQTKSMNRPERICASNLRHLYWSIAQQIAHHTITGCNLRTGDLLATGTISGPSRDALGSLLELTRGGREPLKFPGGEVRRFLEDGDRVTMTAWCQGDGYRIGFGEVSGTILPAWHQ